MDWWWWRRNTHTWRLWKTWDAWWWWKWSWLVVMSKARAINILCWWLWLHRWLPWSSRHRHHGATTCWRNRNWCFLIMPSSRCRFSRFVCVESLSFKSHPIASLTFRPGHIVCIASIIDGLIDAFIVFVFYLVFCWPILLLCQTKFNQLIINWPRCLRSG